jgi:Mrp family chromosome partitioning ATPase
MKLLRQRKNKEGVAMPDLILPMGDGAPVYQFPDSTIDNMRALINRIKRNGEFPQRLAIVSALRQEGVTYISRALATTLAHDTTQKVCIVDVNWWWPSPTDMVAVDNPGLAGIISGEATLEEVIAPSGWSNLVMVPAGSIERQLRPVMARSRALKELLDELASQYDHLILDIPAIQSTSDAIPLASLADACCVVVQQGVTTMEDIGLALDEIAHIKMLGVILNRVKLNTPEKILKYIPMK